MTRLHDLGYPEVRVAVATVVALLGMLAAPPPASGPRSGAVATIGGDGWEELIDAAGLTPRPGASYEAETLWVTYVGDDAHAVRLNVRGGPQGVAVADERGGEVGARSRDVVEVAGRWSVPAWSSDRIALADKYEVHHLGARDVMGRQCEVVELVRRSDGLVRERIWLDNESGLPMRRETYGEDDALVRLVTNLSIELREDAEPAAVAASESVRAPVDDRGRTALRRAGWTLPETLTADYRLAGAWALDEDAQPLHAVYADGLYVVSLYQQRGRLDWDDLPSGAEEVDWLGGRAVAWMNSVPPRVVWEADGSSFALVGDAPQDELIELARALPEPEHPGVTTRIVHRLRTALERLAWWRS